MSRFCKFPTKDNLNTYRVFRAKARRTIKSSKRKSWRTYVSNLNYKTPIKKVWDMVRKISGKSKSASHQHLNTNFNGGAETKATTKIILQTLEMHLVPTLRTEIILKNSKITKNNKKRSSSILSPIIMKNIIIPLI